MTLTKVVGGIIADSTITSVDILDSTITNAKMAVDPSNASNLNSGDVPAAQLDNAPDTDLTAQKADIALLAFKTQANGNLARYNLVDQSVDAFEDATGVDAGGSTDATRDSSGKYYSGASIGAYSGDGSDGALTTSGNVSLVVPNKVGSYDGDMVVKQYSSLTVSAGDTLTVDQPNRGLFIMVTGDCTINGTLSMTARGGNGNPTASGGSDSSAVSATGLRFALKKTGSTDTLSAADFAGTGTTAVSAVSSFPAISGDGKIYTVGRTGGAGGAGKNIPPPNADLPKRPGTSGVATLSSGGGGSGGGYSEGVGLYIGGGAAGSVFSGGPGGGGSYGSSGGMTVAGDGVAYGGAGGQGGGTAVYNIMSGGAGNPGGASPTQDARMDGTGGLLILIVGGNLTIGGSGSIQANGVNGGTGIGNPAPHTSYGGGGGSGGGKLLTLHGGTLTNGGTITSTGGSGGVGDNPANGTYGSDGAVGHVVTEAVGGTSYLNMTLISNAQTAQTQPTKADVVLTYTNGAGTATINTDLIASVSRDGGTTYTSTTLTSQGTTGGHTILSASDVSISGQPAGTSMVWKVATANQSASKDTRIHAVSLGWS
jgi:hypothetical protein